MRPSPRKHSTSLDRGDRVGAARGIFLCVELCAVGSPRCHRFVFVPWRVDTLEKDVGEKLPATRLVRPPFGWVVRVEI